jgi:hypothetical protein
VKAFSSSGSIPFGTPSPASLRNIRRCMEPVRTAAFAGGLLLALSTAVGSSAQAETGSLPITDSTFKCLKDMVKVRHFYVDNLLGNRAATVAVAQKDTGVYPVGSVVQLVPGEVMVKQNKGFSPVTKDWEFFELDVSKEGSKIRKRGFADVVNRFGGNCFACHVKARPEFDFVCELEHGCDPIPINRRMLAAVQRTDPRCPGSENVSADDKKALDELGEVVKEMMKANGVAPATAGESAKTEGKAGQ